jgi:hypothetical protein
MVLNLKNLFKLITHEDNLHIHKIIGVSCLINFIYQFYHLISYSYLPLATSRKRNYILALHGLLSLSSFIFHVPKNRHKGLPMIYKEFRLHSIVFALRSVFCALVYSLELNNASFVNIFIVNLTMILADLSTSYYGVETKTMRGMPFGDNIDEDDKKAVTRMHSEQQFSATIYMLISIQTAFVPLVAIQIAAFLMTLVRKSIIKELDWHRLYALSLWICVFVLKTMNFYEYLFLVFASFYVHWLRINVGINKYIVWNSLGFLGLFFKAQSTKFDSDIVSDATLNTITNITICYYFVKNIYKTRKLWF